MFGRDSWWGRHAELAPPGVAGVLERPAPLAEFCAVCWGAGRILRFARNGEGLVPVSCASCAGGGTT